VTKEKSFIGLAPGVAEEDRRVVVGVEDEDGDVGATFVDLNVDDVFASSLTLRRNKLDRLNLVCLLASHGLE
jgi:hypothetical protein